MLTSQHLLKYCTVAWLASAVTGSVLPIRDEGELFPGPRNLHAVAPLVEASFAGGIPLRIMPLGASITFGYTSPDGNGYRLALRDMIVAGGNEVNMVGNHPNGTMKDNDNEGWPGYVITQVNDKAKASVPKYKPNLVLINAGTNDCVQNIDIPDTYKRMNDMLNTVWADSPQATIILSTLLVNAKVDTEKRVEDVNKQYAALVTTLQKAGKRIVLAEMHGSDGPQLSDLVQDGTHPNEAGYRKMAVIWYKAIKTADTKNFLQKAEVVKGIPDNGA